MTYLRGQSRQVQQSIRDYVLAQLTALGWLDSTQDVDGNYTNLPFQASAPITLVDTLPQREEPIAPNTVAFTSNEQDDEPQEAGAASGGLFGTMYALFFDVFGEDQSIALAIASDLKAILTGKLDGTSRTIDVNDYTASPVVAAPGHKVCFDLVAREKPEGVDYKRNWQVVKVAATHYFNASEVGHGL